MIALPKLGKQTNDHGSYRLISPLCRTEMLLEWLILQRMNPVINPSLSQEHAGFRPQHTCREQVSSITTNVEASFHCNLQTRAPFVDLWHCVETWTDAQDDPVAAVCQNTSPDADITEQQKDETSIFETISVLGSNGVYASILLGLY